MEETWKSDLDRWLSPFVSALRHKTRARMTVRNANAAGRKETCQPALCAPPPIDPSPFLFRQRRFGGTGG